MQVTIPEPMTANPLSPKELRIIDAYWRAANYLSASISMTIRC